MRVLSGESASTVNGTKTAARRTDLHKVINTVIFEARTGVVSSPDEVLPGAVARKINRVQSVHHYQLPQSAVFKGESCLDAAPAGVERPQLNLLYRTGIQSMQLSIFPLWETWTGVDPDALGRTAH